MCSQVIVESLRCVRMACTQEACRHACVLYKKSNCLSRCACKLSRHKGIRTEAIHRAEMCIHLDTKLCSATIQISLNAMQPFKVARVWHGESVHPQCDPTFTHCFIHGLVWTSKCTRRQGIKPNLYGPPWYPETPAHTTHDFCCDSNSVMDFCLQILQVIDWFDHLGFHLPYGVNIAGTD